jgi:hypothetical protein
MIRLTSVTVTRAPRASVTVTGNTGVAAPGVAIPGVAPGVAPVGLPPPGVPTTGLPLGVALAPPPAAGDAAATLGAALAGTFVGVADAPHAASVRHKNSAHSNVRERDEGTIRLLPGTPHLS